MSNGASQLALVVKNPPANAGDVRGTGLIPGLWRSPGGGQGNPLQYSFLENPMDGGACRATVHRVTKSRLWLKWLGMPGCPMNQCVMGFYFTFIRNLFKIFLYLFWAVLGPHCWAWTSSSCGEHRLLYRGSWASHCGSFSLESMTFRAWTSVAVMYGLNCPAACLIPTKDQTHVPWIGRQILTHWTTKGVPLFYF